MKQLSPGIELDTIVAEKVFGLVVVHDPINYRGVSIGEAWRNGSDLPHYSTDLAAAWRLIEWLEQSFNGEFFRVDIRRESETGSGYDRGWSVELPHVDVAAPTLPHAICLAVLAAAEARKP